MLRIFLLFILMISPFHTATAGDPELERGLVDALRLQPGTAMRTPNSGKAIQAYIHEGALNKKPHARGDYTDYWILKRPAKFLGHELIVIEEEYMSRYVGCCVSDGAGVIVKVVGSTANLERFARANKCGIEEVDLKTELENVGIKIQVPSGKYVALSCRERDVRQLSLHSDHGRTRLPAEVARPIQPSKLTEYAFYDQRK